MNNTEGSIEVTLKNNLLIDENFEELNPQCGIKIVILIFRFVFKL